MLHGSNTGCRIVHDRAIYSRGVTCTHKKRNGKHIREN